MKTKFRLGLQAATIILVGLWVYWPAVHGDWVWDDTNEIVQNPVLRDPAGIWKSWTVSTMGEYFPLKTMAQWMEWHLWEDRRLGYHLTNVGLHLLGALLFWGLLIKLRRTSSAGSGDASRDLGSAAGHEPRPRARVEWLGGLLFVVHPLAVESVAWITELKNTLSLPLLLWAMMAYLEFDRTRWSVLWNPMQPREGGSPTRLPAEGLERAPRGQDVQPARRRIFYLLSLFCFLLAILAKSSAVMFPLVLLLYAWWRRGRITARDLFAAVPFFAVALILGLVTVWVQQQRAIGGIDLAIGGLGSRLAGAGLAVAFYLWKFFVPFELMPIYPRWRVVPPHFAQFLPWLALGALVGWLWTKRAGWGRGALFGLGFFGMNLLPVLGLIPIAYLRISWVADHFVYLPMLGLIGLVVGGAGALADRLARTRRGLLPPLSAVAGIVLCSLCFASHRYAAVFQNDETLWSYTLRRNPQAWIAHNNLANFLAGQPGGQADALAHYEAALRLKPDYAEAHNDLAVLLASQPGRRADAFAHYEAALRLRPDFAEAHNNLANLLAREPGRQAEAITHYETALRLKPDYVEAHNNLALLLTNRPERQAEAIAHYETALRLKPDYAEAHYHLANLLVRQSGRQAEAIAHYETALRLKPDYAEAHNDLALLLANRPGRLADALAHYETALRLKPDFAEAHCNLAHLLGRLPGRQAEAIAHDETALRLQPDFAEAHYNLANLLAQQSGRQAEAIAHYEAALRLQPDFAEAHCNLANLLGRQPGRQAEAIAHYEAALRLLPNSAVVHYNLACELEKQPNRQEEAAFHFAAASKISPDFAHVISVAPGPPALPPPSQ